MKNSSHNKLTVLKTVWRLALTTPCFLTAFTYQTTSTGTFWNVNSHWTSSDGGTTFPGAADNATVLNSTTISTSPSVLTVTVNGTSLSIQSTRTLLIQGTTVSAVTVGDSASIGGLGNPVGSLALQGGDGSGITFNGSTGTSTISAPIAFGFGARTISVSNSSASIGLYITGLINTGSITKIGPGVLGLRGNNTFPGGITLSEGTIATGTTSGLGTGSLTMSAGTTLTFSAAVTASNAISLSSTGAIIDVSTASSTLSGIISDGGSAALTKTGSNTLSLTGVNTYTAGTSLNAGTLAVGNASALGNSAGTLTMTAGTTLAFISAVTVVNPISLSTTGASVNVTTASGTLSGIISGASAMLTVTGPSNTLTLVGVNTYGGGTSINSGTVVTAAASVLSSTGSMTIAGAGTLRVAVASQTVGDLSGSGNLIVDTGLTLTAGTSNSTTFSGTISSAGTFIKAGSGTLTLSGSNGYTGGTSLTVGTIGLGNATALGTNTLTMTAGTTLAFTSAVTVVNPLSLLTTGAIVDVTTASGTLSGIISGASAMLTVTGPSNTLTLVGVNTYGGGTSINSGTVVTAAANVFSSTGSMTIAGAGTLRVAVASQTVGDLSGSGNLIVDTGLTLTAGTSNSTTFSGTISSAGTFIKAGSGTLTLSGSNGYTGGTSLTVGTIGLGNATALGTNTLTMTAGTTLAFTSAVTAVNPLSLLTTGAIVDVTTASGTLSGVISDGGSAVLTKTGSNTLSLTRANSYTAGTSLNAGTLAITHSSALGAGTLSMAAGATFALGDALTVVNKVTFAGAETLVVDTSSSSTLSGILSGVGGSFTKTGAGTLSLSGTNTYNTGTTLSLGTLALASNNALGSASLTMADATVLSLTPGLIVSNNVVLGGAETIDVSSAGSSTLSGVLSGVGGSFTKTGVGTLILGGANTYDSGTTITTGTVQTGIANALPNGKNISIGSSGTLQISVASQTIGDMTGSGAVIIDASRTLTLGTATSTVTFSGTISGGGTLTKVGSGTGILLGTNSYTGGTLVSAGTLQGNSNSLQGTINNANNLVFDQTFAGSFTSTITNATGDLTIQGGALLTFATGSSVIQNTVTVVSGGELSVNGNVAAISGFTVNAGGFLQGTGSITASTTIAGSISPGNSIGTLNIMGDYTQAAGSSITIECNPLHADLLNVSGTITIEPETTIFIVPDFGNYSVLQSYTVMQAGTLFPGHFETVSISLPSFSASVVYNLDQDSVDLLLNIIPLAELPLSKDALIVARCLDAATVTPFSDLENVIDQLHFMSTQQMNTTLTQMLPSIFNALDLVQETSLIQVRETLSRQMNLYSKKQCGSLQKIRLWNDFFSTSSSQNNRGHNVGYRAHVTGDVVGLDVQVTESAYVGAGLGYTYDPISWKEERGSGHIIDDFAALYAGGWINRYLYAQGAFIGSTNVYHTKRHIAFQGGEFTPSVKVAKGRTEGHAFLSHFELGCVVEKAVRVRPFIKTDYMFMGRDGFTEEGAESVDLVVKDHNADLLRLEGGIEFLYCIPDGFLKHATPYFSIGDVYELRFIGKTEQASLVDLHCPMTINGLFPEQNLWFFEAGLMSQLFKDRIALVANYRQEKGKDYTDHTWSAQLRTNF